VGFEAQPTLLTVVELQRRLTLGDKNVKIKLAAIFTIFVLASYFVLSDLYWKYSQSFYKGRLPEKLELSGSALILDEFGLREGCGIVVFKLSEHALNQINHKELKFFDGLTKARDYHLKDNRYNHHYSYQEWKETPVEESSENKNFWFGFKCAERRLDKNLSKNIVLGASSKGSYYTGHSEGQLLVIPRIGIIVLSYSG
jgi:hypothetical protein